MPVAVSATEEMESRATEMREDCAARFMDACDAKTEFVEVGSVFFRP